MHRTQNNLYACAHNLCTVSVKISDPLYNLFSFFYIFGYDFEIFIFVIVYCSRSNLYSITYFRFLYLWERF